MRVFAGFAFLVLLVAVAAACGGPGESSTSGGSSGEFVGSESHEPRPAPEISGISLDGEMLVLRDLLAKPVFVNVWASW